MYYARLSTLFITSGIPLIPYQSCKTRPRRETNKTLIKSTNVSILINCMCTDFYYRIGVHQLGRVILRTQILAEGLSPPRKRRQTVNI